MWVPYRFYACVREGGTDALHCFPDYRAPELHVTEVPKLFPIVDNYVKSFANLLWRQFD